MSDDVRVVDNPLAGDVFADDAMSFSLLDGTVRITLCSTKWTQPAPGEGIRVVIGRLVMPLPAAQRLIVGLNDFLTQVGHGPSESMKGGQAVQ